MQPPGIHLAPALALPVPGWEVFLGKTTWECAAMCRVLRVLPAAPASLGALIYAQEARQMVGIREAGGDFLPSPPLPPVPMDGKQLERAMGSSRAGIPLGEAPPDPGTGVRDPVPLLPCHPRPVIPASRCCWGSAGSGREAPAPPWLPDFPLPGPISGTKPKAGEIPRWDLAGAGPEPQPCQDPASCHRLLEALPSCRRPLPGSCSPDEFLLPQSPFPTGINNSRGRRLRGDGGVAAPPAFLMCRNLFRGG